MALVAERGVVFFRAQDGLTNDLQKKLILRLGELSGRPKTSGLHIHPILNPSRGDKEAGSDLEISTISSVQDKKFYGRPQTYPLPDELSLGPHKQYTAQWHSDIAFEPVPADFSSLRLVELPKTGGGMLLCPDDAADKIDTLWASGYDLYDRISPPYQKFLETLTATFAQPGFNRVADSVGFKIYDQPRGAPENVGSELKAVHPVVRTNPITGWKSIYPVGGHVSHINGLSNEESRHLLDWFLDLLQKNHDLQVRFKWLTPNDFGEFDADREETLADRTAIWDNRSVFHTATFDYDGQGERFGNRAVGLGERPYFDPQSHSRREDLKRRSESVNVRLNTE
jgi:alpha-ketoglutarate-dependent taurine dioxygenase